MVQSTGQWLWAEYDNMTVESENNYYTLHVTGYHGDAGDGFSSQQWHYWQSNGMPFSTPDVDNDHWPNANCAVFFNAGWWFNVCSTSRLHGKSTFWYASSASASLPLNASRMMLQCGAEASGGR